MIIGGESIDARIARLTPDLARAVALPGTASCDRDDALQSALLQLIRRRNRLASFTDDELRAYAQTVARAALSRVHRDRARRETRERTWAGIRDVLDPGPLPRLEALEALGAWLAGVARLSTEQQHIILACDIQFIPVAKVAAALGARATTVRTRLRTARRLALASAAQYMTHGDVRFSIFPRSTATAAGFVEMRGEQGRLIPKRPGIHRRPPG